MTQQHRPAWAQFDRRRFLAASATALATGWLGRGHGTVFAKGTGAQQPTLDLRYHQKSPTNAEPALEKLVQSWLTPVEHFYIRSHGNTPEIDAAQYRLEVTGLVDKPLTLSLAELQERYEKATTVAAMTCAGNRRVEHSATKKVAGVPWEAGAIGNARWSGVSLAELLKQAGVKPEAKHVWFDGVDDVKEKGKTIHFGASIPIDKAMQGGALLAYAMNEAPLTPDHGFPLRGVVPGYIGARSVKWLGRITVSDRPSDNHFMTHAYKLVTEDKPEQWDKAEIIYTYPINAAICAPAAGAEVKPGRIAVQGYALAPGERDRQIATVEVSADGGKSWTKASLTSPAREFTWQLWKAEAPVSAETASLAVRATDSAGNVQPEKTEWNLKGYLYNGWHGVPVKVG